MSFKHRKSVLLKTSAKSDVKRSGGNVRIAGLPLIALALITGVNQINYRAEVKEVKTISLPDAQLKVNTRYTLKIGDVNGTREGWSKRLRAVGTTSPDLLTTMGATANDQKDYIFAKLAEIINGDATFEVTAVADTVNHKLVLTDKGNYYPEGERASNPKKGGAVTVVAVSNLDGSGFIDANIVVTTPAVYSFGEGSYLASQAPVFAPSYANNMIAGSIDAPKAADGTYGIAGQKYNAFTIDHLVPADVVGISGFIAYQPASFAVFVDNGTGADVTNLAGYKAFERQMEKLMYAKFVSDPNAIVEFFENGAVTGKLTGGAATGSDTDVNVVMLGRNVLHQSIIGASTAINPAYGADGLEIDLDATDKEGAEYSAPVSANSGKVFTVGKDACSLVVGIKIEDVSGTDDCAIGFRKKAAYAPAIDDYTDMAVLNVISGDIKVETILNNAATTTTDTTKDFADGETHNLEVRVDVTGKARFFVDGIEVTSVLAADFTFDAGDELIPFVYFINAADLANTVALNKFVAVASDAVRA